ncbi:MAG: tRNA (N(6)-L-threonylcarbamoyladenosine(37)-C(2))-methylthiotransferase MtaB [Oscillospiraceae bacterium]|nr:tRNA (N(6)-L-threonylcarbamoyladenosine(37)-C(2))-methylthiotransferase MtaB [Oscillospiraceae bacterium]
MRFHFVTLGCKVNQFETAAMTELLRRGGHELCDSEADAVIINTCAVTAESVRKSRQAVRRARKDFPGAVIAVCGCASQADEAEMAALGADLVGGSGDRAAFVEKLCGLVGKRPAAPFLDAGDPMARREYEPLPAKAAEGRTRALLKVEDGCVNYCAYCIIPHLRGPVRSLAAEAAARQAKGLAAEGFKEIVLTGIELASWGRDLPGKPGLEALIREVALAVPQTRIRLGSLEPRVVTPEFTAALLELPNIAPHFHLSLQSGCDATLARMRRKYDTARFFESVELLRGAFPQCGLTADLICGFPGETDADAEETLRFIARCRFSDMHIFPFSPRPGTPAAEMDGRVPNAVKKARCAAAAEVADKMRAGFLDSLLGSEQDVIFERGGVGHTGNYCLVSVPGTQPGRRARVRITGRAGGELTGELL